MTTQDNIFDFNTRHNLQKQQAQCYHCLHILLVSVCVGSLRVLWVPPTRNSSHEQKKQDGARTTEKIAFLGFFVTF